MVQKNDYTLVDDWEFYMQKASSNKNAYFYPKKDQNSTRRSDATPHTMEKGAKCQECKLCKETVKLD